MGWKVRLDVDHDDGTSKRSRWGAVALVLAVSLWIVVIAVVIRWLEGLLLR